MQPVDYDGHQHAVYHAGRRHPDVTVQQWRALLWAHAGDPPPRRWIDIGAGTGRFTILLAELFAAEVVGIEPSSGMRAEALANSAHPRIEYRAGAAEMIAAPDASFDAAMMSMVYHHLREPQLAAAEIRRVLSPGGRLFVRSALRDRHLDSTFYTFFEAARRIDRDRLPSLADIRACFEAAGFRERHRQVVRQITDSDLRAFEARMQTRPFSTFELMTAQEIEDGFVRLATAIAPSPTTMPAFEHVDLLVLDA